MKRIVVWSAQAADDYHRQLEYIAERSAVNADLVDQRIMAAIDLLAEMPTGHAGRVSGTYEKVIGKTSLIVAYSLRGQDRLEIIRIIHGARNWPAEGWPEDQE